MHNIIILYDDNCESIQHLTKVALTQFEDLEVNIKHFSYIQKMSDLTKALNYSFVKSNVIIINGLIDLLFIEEIKTFSENNDIHVINILADLLENLGTTLDMKPLYTPHKKKKLDSQYFQRIEAMEFAVRFDDGKETIGVKEADCVILGVSRTSKTPLCIYLAYKNIKAINIPIVDGTKLPDEIFEIDRNRIYGLTCSVDKLSDVRESRLENLGISSGYSYTSKESIFQETEYAYELFKRLGCPVIDVTKKSIEETAEKVIDILTSYKLR